MGNVESTNRLFQKNTADIKNKAIKDQINKRYLKTPVSKIGEGNAKVTIPDAVKDFGRIKKLVENTPDIDQSEKIARLKNQIGSGKYEINYDALAEKIAGQEF